MSVGQYPTPRSSSHSSEPDGPGIASISPTGTNICGYNLQQLPNEYASVIVKPMVDNGATYGADSGSAVLRWKFTYTGLSATQAAVLDTHFASAKNQLLGFAFRDPRTDTMYSDVHYESYEYPPHTFYQSQSRIVTLVKRPA